MMRGLASCDGAFIAAYPEFPRELPAALFAAAYSEVDPPIQRHVARYESIGPHVPLRKSSKLLKSTFDEPQGLSTDVAVAGQHTVLLKAMAAFQASQRRRGDDQDGDVPITFLNKRRDVDMYKHSGAQAQWGHSHWDQSQWHGSTGSGASSSWWRGSSALEDDAAQGFKPRGRQGGCAGAAEPAALEDEPAAEKKEKEGAGWDTPGEGKRATSADIEDAAYEALLARPKKKGAASSSKKAVATVSAQAKCHKRPAAAVLLKRPARAPKKQKVAEPMSASQLNLLEKMRNAVPYDDLLKKADIGTRTRNCFCSRAFAIVRRRCLAQKATAAVAKLLAREAFGKAAEKFDAR